MIKLFNKLLSHCKTTNQVNRFCIALSHRMTPDELYQLRQEFELQYFGSSTRLSMFKTFTRLTHLERNAYHQIVKLINFSDKSGKCTPQAFVRKNIRANIKLFSSPGRTEEKTLAICFAGNAQRLMMHISCFLQHLPDNKYDVLLLKDPSKNGFRNGIAGISKDCESLIVELDNLVDRSAYKSVVSFGVSGGGLPSLWTALQLQLDKGISISGRSPTDLGWEQIDSNGYISDTLSTLTAQANPHPNLLHVYSETHEIDKLSAFKLARIIPIHTLSVRSKTNKKIGHTAVKPFLEQGMFASFIEVVLDPVIVGYNGKQVGSESSEVWI